MADHTLDVKNKPLGRIASQIASILQGKNEASYDPRLSGTERVLIKNVAGISISGKKKSSKIYYKHSGPLGHLKEKKYQDVLKKNPAWILRHAVYSMLPKNRLRAKRMRRLIIN